MENVILTVFNYAQNNREQFLLVKLFERALKEEVEYVGLQVQIIYFNFSIVTACWHLHRFSLCFVKKSTKPLPCIPIMCLPRVMPIMRLMSNEYWIQCISIKQVADLALLNTMHSDEARLCWSKK